MKTAFLFLCSLFLAFSGAISQNITFTDLKLKAFLVNKICIDTDNDSIPDAVADANADGEIQVSEALAVIDLEIEDFSPPRYWIKSITDLSHFKNLDRLTLLHNDSLPEISNLSLDSLSFLWIGTLYQIKRIDISDLPAITTLRIEDIAGLDYLNLQNGSVATNIFSLFYTQDIEYACVDSIAEEYYRVAQHMGGPNPVLTVICDTLTGLTSDISNQPTVDVYPVPSGNQIFLKSNQSIEQVRVLDLAGKIVQQYNHQIRLLSDRTLDLSPLPAGIYFLEIQLEGKLLTQKVLKE